MIRPLVFSFAVATVAACSMLATPQVSARAMGGFSIDTTGPITPTPLDPFGGVELCTAHLRKLEWDSSGNLIWVYHMASGYDVATCYNNAQIYINMGYEHNDNPGFEFCQCHPGFNGLMVAGPAGHGPLGMHNLTQDQVQVYDEGVLQLRENYQLNELAEEHELLLQTIQEMDEPDGR